MTAPTPRPSRGPVLVPLEHLDDPVLQRLVRAHVTWLLISGAIVLAAVVLPTTSGLLLACSILLGCFGGGNLLYRTWALNGIAAERRRRERGAQQDVVMSSAGEPQERPTAPGPAPEGRGQP